MVLRRHCKICGNTFNAIKATQFFCCRKCFKRDYYNRTKIRNQEKDHNPVYPIKECGFCFKNSSLKFDPIKYPKLYDHWQCPYCGTTNKLIWENQDRSNSYQIISQMISSFQVTIHSENKIIEYQRYNLPVERLEHGNPNIVVLACEKLNIFDIQRKNRKRILFS